MRDYTPEEIERYRRMTPGERLSESLRLTREEMDRVMQGTPEEIDAFFERVNREHEESTQALLAGFQRLKLQEEQNASDQEVKPGLESDHDSTG